MRLFVLLLLTVLSHYAAASCNHLYPNNTPLKIPNTVELCNSFYVSLYNPTTHAVIAVSEKLSHGSPVGSISRLSTFYPDARIGRFPTNSHYVGSGYDRGHMVPSDDASTVDQMKETFLLTNITPQAPGLNRGPWKRLENQVRKIHQRSTDDVYVLTVAEYKAPTLMRGIPVPSGYWKIVYVNDSQHFYYAPNSNTATVIRVPPVALSTLWK